MTPRVDTFALPDDLTNEEAIAQLKERRHRRVPVYSDTPDQIVGIIDVKSFLLNPAEHYTETLLAPSFVPETMRAMDLLRSFLSHPQGLAIVVDEFGGTEGIITLSDIIEEIISDAAPLGDADLYIEPLEDGRFLVSGNARLDDLREHLGFEIEAEGIDTIGGFVFNRLGYLPAFRRAIGNAATCHHGPPHRPKTHRRNAFGKNNVCQSGGRKRNLMTRWFLILACWAVSFLFSGIEAGLLAIDPVRLRSQAKKEETAAVRLQRLLRHPERLLVTVLLVTNMADILALLLLTHRFVHVFGSPGFLFALLVALPIYVFVLGVLPKSLFRRFPFRALASLGRMLEIVSIALWPVLELGKQIGRLFLPAKSERAGRLFAAREELKQITAQSEAEGSLTATERVMIHNVVDFTMVKASDVMVPLEQAVTIQTDTPVTEILQLSESTHIDRMPVLSRKATLSVSSMFPTSCSTRNRDQQANTFVASLQRRQTSPPIA